MTGAVADTNIFISAVVFRGVPQQVLDLISVLEIPLYISQSIMD